MENETRTVCYGLIIKGLAICASRICMFILEANDQFMDNQKSEFGILDLWSLFLVTESCFSCEALEDLEAFTATLLLKSNKSCIHVESRAQ